MLGAIWPDVPPSLQPGYWPAVMSELVALARLSNSDEVTREAALAVLETAVASGEEALEAASASGLEGVLEPLAAHLSALSGEAAGWAEEQLRLVSVLLARLGLGSAATGAAG